VRHQNKIARRRHELILLLIISATVPVSLLGQSPEPLGAGGKLHYHLTRAYGPLEIVGTAAYAAVLHEATAPTEWGQGGGAYAKRFASTLAWSGIHSTMAFGLDSLLHQDPRYFRSRDTSFWQRSAHALRGTILTRTDAGGETFSWWRFGSAYGAAYISNQWYPDRVNTARLGFIQGSVTVGFDLLGNLGSEFWPDVKRKVLRRK
jgi:hypothetical protein